MRIVKAAAPSYVLNQQPVSYPGKSFSYYTQVCLNEECRLSGAANLKSTESSNLQEFLKKNDGASSGSHTFATIDLTGSLIRRLDLNVPPIPVDDLYAGWYDKLRLAMNWIIFGVKGSRVPTHTDVWNTSTWNLLLCGRKTWTVVELASEQSETFVQVPGEVLHIPTAFSHSVFYDEDSVCVTGNYVQRQHARAVAEQQDRDGLHGLASFTRRLLGAAH